VAAPDDVGAQLEEAQSHAWLADAREKVGSFDAARERRTAELAIYTSVLAGDPNNNDARRGELVARSALARLSEAKGNLPEALEQLRIATGLADSLMQIEPDNTLWADIGADVNAFYGEVAYRFSNIELANTAARHSCALAQDLVKRDASVVRWRAFHLSRCQSLQATLAAHAGDHNGALEGSREVVARIDALKSADKEGDQPIRWQLGAALLAIGDECRAMNRSDDAHAAWERVVAVLGPQQEREDAAMQTILATALLRLGRADEAAPIVAKWERAGYAHPDFIAIKTERVESAVADRSGSARGH
jgi:tetratricopeptide (TPR) repeat protein